MMGAPHPQGQGGELAALAAEAEGIEREAINATAADVHDAPDAAEQQRAEKLQREADEWQGVLSIARTIVGKVRADVAACFTDADLRDIANAAAAVSIKRQWSVGDLFGQWGEEIGLALALVGPGLKVAAIVKASREPAPAPSGGQGKPAGEGGR